MTPYSNELTDQLVTALIEAARDAATRAYVPYSNFPVGAAVLTEDGSIVGGVNIENASFGLTVCGERVALFTAAAQGHRTVRALAVSASRKPGTTPCGACRQVINEFKPELGPLHILLDSGTTVVRTTLDALLPSAFGPRDLQ
ncbi:MAG: cytidine deaminase [Thermomicrobiales bacterium]